MLCINVMKSLVEIGKANLYFVGKVFGVLTACFARIFACLLVSHPS